MAASFLGPLLAFARLIQAVRQLAGGLTGADADAAEESAAACSRPVSSLWIRYCVASQMVGRVSSEWPTSRSSSRVAEIRSHSRPPLKSKLPFRSVDFAKLSELDDDAEGE